MNYRFAVLLAITISACAAAPSKGIEQEDAQGAKLDSLRAPTDHGPIAFDQQLSTTLDDRNAFHAWTFSLSAQASVDAVTSYGVGDDTDVYTVLYIHRREADGAWGRAVARDDDDGKTLFSHINVSLEAGEYRVLVKGYSQATRGTFSLTLGCTGDGCGTPPAQRECLFGDSYRGLFFNGHFAAVERVSFENASMIEEVDLDGMLARMTIEAAALCYAQTRTLIDAFDNVDDGGFNVSTLVGKEPFGTYIAIEYGAGDNSYGAIFDAGTERLVAKIHDGDIYPSECFVFVA